MIQPVIHQKVRITSFSSLPLFLSLSFPRSRRTLVYCKGQIIQGGEKTDCKRNVGLSRHGSVSVCFSPPLRQLRLTLAREQPVSLSQQLSCDPQHQRGTQSWSSICALMYLSKAEDGAEFPGDGYFFKIRKQK